MAVNYYKKDKKTNKWVVDDRFSFGGKGSKDTSRNTSVSAGTTPKSSSEKQQDRLDPISKALSDWDSFLKAKQAEAAVIDSSNAASKYNALGRKAEWNMYKPGGSDELMRVGVPSGYKERKTQIPEYNKNRKGQNVDGLSQKDIDNIMAQNDEILKGVTDMGNLTSARTGDASVLEGKKGKEKQKLQGAYNLYGRDQVYAALNKKTSQPSKANVSGLFDSPDAMTKWLEGQYAAGDDAFDKQMQSILAEKNTIGSRAEMYNNYSREEYRNDLNVIYSYNNPAKRGNITEDDYMRAMVRAQAATGQDFKSAVSNGLDVNWFKGALDAYDSGQKSMYEEMKASGALDQDMSYEDYLDNMEAVNARAAMQDKQQQRMNDWESTTAAQSAQIQGNEDYGAVSAYRQDNSIGQLTPNADYLSGSKIYYDAEGNAMRPEDYRQAVMDSILNEYVAAGNDAEARAALEGYSGLIPELQNYNLEAIPYMSDEQKSNFFYLYNSGDKNGARAYLEALVYWDAIAPYRCACQP